MNKRNRIVFWEQLPYLRAATVAGVMCAAVVSWPSACLAQEGIGLTLTPRQYVRPGDPLLTVDKDEEGQAQTVFKEPLWRAFVDTATRELQPPPDPEQLAASCRRSIRIARLTSKALLLDGCISEALEDIDPVGSYISQRQYRSAQRERQRPAGAVGLELPARKPYGEPLTVIAPIEGGPAARAGMLPGDVVEFIDGVSLRPLNQDELLDLLRGEPGRNAHLKLRRNEADIELDVKREVIKTRTVRILRLHENVLYARVSHFRAAATASELASGLHTSLLAGPRPKLGILDLRMNPGGAVSEVSSVASLFVPFGEAVLGVSSRLGVEMHTSAPPKDETQWQQLVPLLSGVPLVVLVDARTGGGAEVLAHILRERMGAKIVGEPTAQIDNVLKYFDLRGQAAVQLTFGHFVSSSGRREYSSGVPLDAVLEGTPHGEFGDPRTDGMLAATLERFAN